MQICNHCGAIAQDTETLEHYFPCETDEIKYWKIFYQQPVAEEEPEEDEEDE